MEQILNRVFKKKKKKKSLGTRGKLVFRLQIFNNTAT